MPDGLSRVMLDTRALDFGGVLGVDGLIWRGCAVAGSGLAESA
jgi:hypothetical protein